MLKIRYERYLNDYHRRNESRTFSTLHGLEEWMFDQMQQNYTRGFAMCFPTPEKAARIGERGPWRIEFTPVRGSETIFIHQIESFDGILFSDGVFTAGQKYWSVEIQDWLVHCEERRKNPRFSFAGAEISQPRWYGVVRWCAEDVIAAAERNGITLTEAQAETWLEKNERWFKEMLTEYGNEVLASASKESFEEVCKA